MATGLFATAVREPHRIFWADGSFLYQTADGWAVYQPPGPPRSYLVTVETEVDGARLLMRRGIGPASLKQFTPEDIQRGKDSHARAQSQNR